MGEMGNKKRGIFATGILLVTLMTSLIMAFGVAIPYWDSPEWYPLKLAQGESKIVVLTLQNTGEEDMIFRATIISGSEIATLIDDNLDYFVASGEVNKLVNIRVEIPADLGVGSPNQTISVSFQQIGTGGSGMVTLATGIVASFPVEIVGYEESVKRTEEPVAAEEKRPISKTTLIILIIAIIIVLGLIVFSGMKKKKTKKSK